MSKRMAGIVNRGLNVVRSKSQALAVATMATVTTVSSVAMADGPSLPSTGVEVGALATLAIAALGAIVVTIVGGYFAFKLIKLALRWVGKIGG